MTSLVSSSDVLKGLLSLKDGSKADAKALVGVGDEAVVILVDLTEMPVKS